MALIGPDIHSPALERYMEAHPGPITISRLGILEFSSAISTRVRQDVFTPEQAWSALNTFDAFWPSYSRVIEVTAEDYSAADAFVRRFDLALRGPDALHIAVSRRLETPLLTFDRAQARAAGHLGVPAITPV